MHIILGFAVLLCLAVVGFGFYLALEEQRQIMSYSATTTATVVEERLERFERPIEHVHRPHHHEPGRSRFSYQPLVRYRYEVNGRQVIGANIFPEPFRIGGNLGYLAAKAPLDRFEIGQPTRAYYNPDRPSSVCLIRRPSMMPYLVLLAPVIAASVLVAALLQSGRPGFKRQKAGWIATVWLFLGVAAAGPLFLAGRQRIRRHSFEHIRPLHATRAGSDDDCDAAFHVIPPVKQVKGVIGFSLFGTFVGLWLGLLIGWVALKVLFGQRNDLSAVLGVHHGHIGGTVCLLVWSASGRSARRMSRQVADRPAQTGTATRRPGPSPRGSNTIPH